MVAPRGTAEELAADVSPAVDGAHLKILGQTLEDFERKLRHFVLRLEDEVVPAIDEARRALGSGADPETVDAVLREGRSALQRLTEDIRPSTLDYLGLVPAVRRLLSRWSEGRATSVEFRLEAVESRLPPAVETAAYRIVEESLLNVARYANASRVTVTLREGPGGIECLVADDGTGFDPEEIRIFRSRERMLGLQFMEAWAGLVGGDLSVTSAPGEGTTVHAWLPTDRARTAD